MVGGLLREGYWASFIIEDMLENATQMNWQMCAYNNCNNNSRDMNYTMGEKLRLVQNIYRTNNQKRTNLIKYNKRRLIVIMGKFLSSRNSKDLIRVKYIRDIIFPYIRLV